MVQMLLLLLLRACQADVQSCSNALRRPGLVDPLVQQADIGVGTQAPPHATGGQAPGHNAKQLVPALGLLDQGPARVARTAVLVVGAPARRRTNTRAAG